MNIKDLLITTFLIGLIILLYLCMFYFIFLLIIEISKLNWGERRKKLYTFTTYFIFLCVVNYMVDTIFTSLSFDLYTIVSNSLGLSFGLVAIDLVFNKKKA